VHEHGVWAHNADLFVSIMFAPEKAIVRWTATRRDGLNVRSLCYRVKLRHNSTQPFDVVFPSAHDDMRSAKVFRGNCNFDPVFTLLLHLQPSLNVALQFK